MVDEPGQDPVEVEPAADVARDAAQGLGAMELAAAGFVAVARAPTMIAPMVSATTAATSASRGVERPPVARRRRGGRPTARRDRG